jgi:NADH-quinone oxidoreductase subunit A
MLRSYLPALVFLGLGTIVGTAFAFLNALFGSRGRRVASKGDPYECGLPSEVKKGFRFGISFYLIAMLFILFDIEVIFLYPVAIQLREFGVDALAEDRPLRRSARHRLHLPVAPGCARMEVVRHSPAIPGHPTAPSKPEQFRIEQLRARDMLRGDLEGDDLESSSSSASSRPPSTRPSAGRRATRSSR